MKQVEWALGGGLHPAYFHTKYGAVAEDDFISVTDACSL